MVILSYMDGKGAGVCINIRNEEELLKRLKRMRAWATVRDHEGNTIGGVEKAAGQDDRRIRWNWWYCKDDVRAALKVDLHMAQTDLEAEQACAAYNMGLIRKG